MILEIIHIVLWVNERESMKKTSKFFIVCIILLLINIGILLFSTSKLNDAPNNEFIDIMDHLFTSDEVVIYKNDDVDITKEFKMIFEETYKNKNYQLLSDVFLENGLSASWMTE